MEAGDGFHQEKSRSAARDEANDGDDHGEARLTSKSLECSTSEAEEHQKSENRRRTELSRGARAIGQSTTQPSDPSGHSASPDRSLPASPARSTSSSSDAYTALPLPKPTFVSPPFRSASVFRWLPDAEFLSKRERQGAKESKEKSAHESAEVQRDREEETPRVNQKFALLQPTGPSPGLKEDGLSKLGLTAQPPSQLVTAQSPFQWAAQTHPANPARIRPSLQTHAVDLRFLIPPWGPDGTLGCRYC